MKIISIVGARPQFIKAAALSQELTKYHTEIILHTGQHYDDELSQIFFDDLEIPKPKYNLGVGSGPHGAQTGKMLVEIEKVLVKEMPDMVLVYGDTNSTLAGALAAAKLHLNIAHVEAGLRSFDRNMPEEINRILADHVSKILLCPTVTAVRNLKIEGITQGVHDVGDVMYDLLLKNLKISRSSTILTDLDLEPRSYLLATVHRPENTDNKKNLQNIVNAFTKSREKIIFPAHFRTVKYLKKFGLYGKLTRSKNVTVLKPIGYLDFLNLMANSSKILTDSGGIQKESYILKVPCITLRENTEWVETVNETWNVLVGARVGKITDAIRNFQPKKPTKRLFGDGKARIKIRKILRKKI